MRNSRPRVSCCQRRELALPVHQAIAEASLVRRAQAAQSSRHVGTPSGARTRLHDAPTSFIHPFIHGNFLSGIPTPISARRLRSPSIVCLVLVTSRPLALPRSFIHSVMVLHQILQYGPCHRHAPTLLQAQQRREDRRVAPAGASPLSSRRVVKPPCGRRPEMPHACVCVCGTDLK